MIKRFIDSIENIALKAMFSYIDSRLDNFEDRISKLEKASDGYNDVKKVVESDAKSRASIKKIWMTAFITTVVNILVAYILLQFGISKGGG